MPVSYPFHWLTLLTHTSTVSPIFGYSLGPYTNRGSSTPLRLENKSTDKYLAYKVKTIDTRRYVVKPTNGIIAPGASVDVALSILPLASPEAVKEFLTTKQKFLVQWRVLSTAPEPAETGYALVSAPT